MHILKVQVVNDDGPPSNQSSPYIHSFISILQSAGHTVSVILPHTQRSWVGKAHIVGAVVKPTYFRPGSLHQDDGTTHSKPLPSGAKGEEWVLVDGTPASCVQIGLYHFFKDRGPVDLVVSGPNYGRNCTAVFSLSSGTLGGALEGAVCRRKSIALSYAFFSRNHDPGIIARASKLSVKLIEHLYESWGSGVDLYTINVPLVEGVERNSIMYTSILHNYWSSGSSFEELEVDAEDADPREHESQIRSEEAASESGSKTHSRHQHKHFKWAPRFSDVYQSVENSAPGNDGWAVKEGYISVTPLKANFMHAVGPEGELKLPDPPPTRSKTACPTDLAFYALIEYEDPYVQPLILKALRSRLSPSSYRIVKSLHELPKHDIPVLQFTSYETLDFEHILDHPVTSLGNAYLIRKALIRKHYLANTISSWVTKYPKSILHFHFQPTIDFELDYAEFLDEALVEAFELKQSFDSNEGKEANERQWWILKPGMSDRGQGIRLFSSKQELGMIFGKWEAGHLDSDDEEEEEYASGSVRITAGSDDTYDRPMNTAFKHADDANGIVTSQLRHFVAQPYIHPPLLLPSSSQRKFHIRTYVVVVGSLRVYVYRDMLALFAALPYTAPWEKGGDDLRGHLTNTCLQDGNREGLVRRFWNLETPEHLRDGWKEDIWQQVSSITGEVFEAGARGTMVHFQTLPNAFEIFGLDYLIDAKGMAWLLEVNAFPDFKQTGKDLSGVIQGLFDGVVDVAIAPFFGLVGQPEGDEQMSKVLHIDLGR
ncbi:MAG: hypothetical protein M1827_002787 [Pycnora praestabilis]|nr:MAG: hypothetical protein M1827_002787 [Pycnora praestabilis]